MLPSVRAFPVHSRPDERDHQASARAQTLRDGLATPNGNKLGFDIYDYIPDGVLAIIAAEFSGLLNATDAAAYLGIKPFLLTKLTRPDLIPVLLREEKALPLYHVSALAGFLDRLDRLRETSMPQDGWEDIAAAAHRTKITTERAVALILLHKLSLRYPHGEAAGFRDFLIDPALLREAISLPQEGAVHPKRAAQHLHLSLPPSPPSLRMEIWTGFPSNDRHQPGHRFTSARISSTLFPDMFISKRDLCRQIEGRANLLRIDDLLTALRLVLRENTEPIYRREILDFF